MGEQVALHNDQLQLESGLLLLLSSLGHKCLLIMSHTLAVQQHSALLLSAHGSKASLYPGSMQCACEQHSGSFLLHPPAWHCGISGNETGSAFQGVSCNNCQDYFPLSSSLSQSQYIVFQAAFCLWGNRCDQAAENYGRQQKTKLAACEKPKWSFSSWNRSSTFWCLFVTTELETFFKQFIPT